MTAPEREEWDAVAAEYVLGVLTRAEATAVERRLAMDPGLARLVDAWSERLIGLADVPDALPRSAALWERIEHGLEPRKAATQVRRQRPPRQRLFAGLEDRLWSSLRFWRFGAAAGALATLVMAVVTALTPAAGPRPTVVTVLQAEDGAPAWIVQAYADATLQVTPLRPITVPADRVLELWSLRDRQTGPVSLGPLPAAGITGLSIGHRPQPASGDLFEITLEGADGSPTGRPTGPVLGKGMATDAS